MNVFVRAVVLVAASALISACSSYRIIERTHIPSQELANEGARALLPSGVDLRAISAAGLKVTKHAEGWVPHLYDDSASYCTIGYGHLVDGRISCKEADALRLADFVHGLTRTRGETLLISDMATAQYTVMKVVVVPITDGQFAALSDFVFNIGSMNFRASTLLKVINAHQQDHVAEQLRLWVLAKGIPQPGLVKRREAEIGLFFDGQPQPKGLPRPGETLKPLDIETGQSAP